MVFQRLLDFFTEMLTRCTRKGPLLHHPPNAAQSFAPSYRRIPVMLTNDMQFNKRKTHRTHLHYVIYFNTGDTHNRERRAYDY